LSYPGKQSRSTAQLKQDDIRFLLITRRGTQYRLLLGQSCCEHGCCKYDG
jgi:hypothetical protein